MSQTAEVSPFSIPQEPDDIYYEQLLTAAGSAARLALYKKSVSSLPLPPALWNAFQRACREEASSQELGNIIQDDPVLSASILRAANSKGLVLRPINDISQAIARLGQSLVRSVVASHSFAASTPTHHKAYDVKQLWKHGMAVSALAKVVAGFIPGCNADEAATIGLFHDVGRIGFNLITEFMQPADLDICTGYLSYEYQRFACTHIDMGLVLAEHWQLPEKICQGIRFHHHPAYAEADAIPADVRAEVLAVYIADLLAIRAGCSGGNPGIMLPHSSFAALLPNTSLAELSTDKRVTAELNTVQIIAF